MSARCEIFIGVLVSHPCGARAVVRCPGCSRPICKHHLHERNPAQCVQCAGVYEPPVASTTVDLDELVSFTSDEFAVFDQAQQDTSMLLHHLDS